MIRGLFSLFLVLIVTFGVWANAGQAQGQVYVQIEAYPDLANTERRVVAYAELLPDVRAFRLASGWYGIAAGPYSPAAAAQRLAELSNQGLVPSDAYVEIRPIYIEQVFPAGGQPPAEPQPLVETQAAVPEPEPEPQPEAEPEPVVVVLTEETPAEARQSEAQLDRTQREALQIALQWFGVYTSGIDGAFGPGTRNAMQNWQASNGHEPTGVLTTRQRAELLESYQAELAALGMRFVTDLRAGVEMNMPMAMVEFARYEFPFAQYEAINDSGVRILLISQDGTSRTLAGLYEIMQTLEIVPLQGTRQRDGESFLLTGRSAALRSHTEAYLRDGQIKGFTLIWPPERDDQMARVLPMMQESFAAVSGVLGPDAVSAETLDGADLLAGLEVRTPELRRTGFFATAQGAVVTTTDVVAGQCTRILIDDVYEATLAYRDDANGLAVLVPIQPLAPVGVADLSLNQPRRGSAISVAGFPYEGALGAASLNIGTFEEAADLDGNTDRVRLALDTIAGEAGGPVLDGTGRVTGMLLPQPTSGRTLPPGVAFALNSSVVRAGLVEAGLIASEEVVQTIAPPALGAQALARLGADITVLVSCWN
ncbi:MAG: serine protease [Pseudomonadota bacterium]